MNKPIPSIGHLRNARSSIWGDGGYFMIAMGDCDCGVTTSTGYAKVDTTRQKKVMQANGLLQSDSCRSKWVHRSYRVP